MQTLQVQRALRTPMQPLQVQRALRAHASTEGTEGTQQVCMRPQCAKFTCTLSGPAFAVFEKKVFWVGFAAALKRAHNGPAQPPTPGRCGVGARKRGSNAQARLRTEGACKLCALRAHANFTRRIGLIC